MMLVETAKDQICINQIMGQKKEMVTVEGDVIVNDIKPDVLNVINISGTVCVYKKEVMDGKVRLDGSINTYIIYLADDGNGAVRSLNTVLDFTKFMDIDNCKNGMTLDEDVEIKDFEFNILNSRKINIKSNLEVKAKVYSKENVEVINNIENIEDIQVLKNQVAINSLIGQGLSKTYAKDNISIDTPDDLAEIMQANFKIIGKEAKTSYNKVLVKAESDINIMYLTEDNRISTVNAKLPIMGFIDIPNVNDDNICEVKCKLKNLTVKPNNGETRSIYIEAEIDLICFVYETKEIDVIEDMYSISSDLNCKKKEINTMAKKHKIKNKCSVKEKIAIPEIGINKLYNVTVRPNITNMERQKGKLVYEGDVNLDFLFESNNIMDKKNMKLPFSFIVESELAGEKSDIDTEIEIGKENFIIVSDGNIETDLDLDFNIGFSDDKKLEIIEEIIIGETRDANLYSMVIYFVKPGDTLWKIAKKLKSTIEDIQRVNDLEEGSKIYPGQQLYIPKYVRRSIEIA